MSMGIIGKRGVKPSRSRHRDLRQDKGRIKPGNLPDGAMIM